MFFSAAFVTFFVLSCVFFCVWKHFLCDRQLSTSFPKVPKKQQTVPGTSKNCTEIEFQDHYCAPWSLHQIRKCEVFQINFAPHHNWTHKFLELWQTIISTHTLSLPSLKENTMPVFFFQLHLEYKDFSLKRKHNARVFTSCLEYKDFVIAEFLACPSCMLTLVRDLSKGAIWVLLAPSFLPKNNEILDLQIH